MKGLALNIIWAIVIALASLFVLLSLMGTFKVASNWFYCNVYIGISNFSPEKRTPLCLIFANMLSVIILKL